MLGKIAGCVTLPVRGESDRYWDGLQRRVERDYLGMPYGRTLATQPTSIWHKVDQIAWEANLPSNSRPLGSTV